MSDNRYDVITWRGFKFDRYTIYNIEAVERALGFTLRVVQGSYNRGGVAASAGTHDGGGAADFSIGGMSLTKIQTVVKALRKQGFAAWYRPPNWDGRGGGPHIHVELIGNEKASAGAKSQWSLYRRFLNGLANNGRDLTWHPALIRSAPYPSTTLRFGQFNFPGEDKLPDGPGRIEAMWSLVKPARLHVIGWNELVGIKAPHKASDFARAVDARLGAAWLLIKPTLPLNENYISYRGDVLELVHQYADTVLPSATGGRHLTRVVFRYKDGFTFAVGQTHLVNDGGVQGEKDRQTQAAAILKSMQAVVAKHDNCPFYVGGDMNTHADLTAFTKAGLKRTRKYADNSTSRDQSTYTNYAKTKPSTNTDWIIDHQYVTPSFYVVAYSVIYGLVKGLFRKPRPSDHALVVTEVRGTSA